MTFQRFLHLWGVFIILCSVISVRAQDVQETAESLEHREQQANELILGWTRESLEIGIAQLRQTADQWLQLRNRKRYLACLTEIARTETKLGRRDLAARTLATAILFAKTSDLSDERMVLLAESSLLAFDSGKTDQSRKEWEIALDLAENSVNPAASAFAYYSAAEFNYFNVNNEKAKEYYELAIEGWRGTNRVGEIKALIGLGYLYMRLDENQKGRELFEIAYAAAKEVNDRRGQAAALKALGSSLNNLNQKQAALDHYLAAERMFPPDIDATERGILFNGIGSIFEFYTDWDEALRYKTMANELFVRDNFVYGQLATLPNLGRLSFQAGDEQMAANYLRKALELAAATRNRFQLGLSHTELGNIYFEKRSFPEALREYTIASRIYDEIGNTRQASLIFCRIGEIYLELGDIPTSRRYLEKSLEISKKVQNDFLTAYVMFQQAKLEYSDGNAQAAMAFVSDSVELTNSLSSDVANSKLQTIFRSKVFERYELYVRLLMLRSRDETDGRFEVEALKVVERARVRSILENLALSEADFTADADPEIVNKEKEIRISLNAKSDKLIDGLSRMPVSPEVSELEKEINGLQYQLENIKADLKQRSPVYAAIKDPPPFDVGEFQSKVLDDNSLLLEFSIGKDQSYLWVVGKTTFDWYILPPREQIESRIEKLRGLLSENTIRANEPVDDFQKRILDAGTEYVREARLLSNEILGPAADKLSGKRLIVVADGKIQYFPLAALPLPYSATDEPLLLSNEVVYAPSAAALMLIKKMSVSGPEPQKDLLLVSDPVFSTIDERLGNSNGANTGLLATVLGNFRSFESLELLPRLPASLEESRSITDIVGELQATGRSGFEANRENVLNSGLADYKALHFATHGLIDEQRPELSGIVLSLFDEAGNRQNGGFIRLQDVYGMKLNADLVVLSACDTGVGKEIKGEGLLSLNNAFIQAGAKSVVSSLWKVDDVATKELMTEFYRGIAAENLTSSVALRRAQIKLQNDPRFRSPFYWASFTAQGDFDSAPKFSRRLGVWTYGFLSAPILIFAALCLWLYRKRRFAGFAG